MHTLYAKNDVTRSVSSLIYHIGLCGQNRKLTKSKLKRYDSHSRSISLKCQMYKSAGVIMQRR